MDFDNRPVAFMEEDESAEARDKMPGLWRDSRTSMGDLMLGESEEDMAQQDSTPGLWRVDSGSQVSGSIFGNEMRFGERSSGGDTVRLELCRLSPSHALQ
jgi:hypothetical protein